MPFSTSIVNALAVLVLIAPPDFDPTDYSVRCLVVNGIQVFRCNPCEWSGLHFVPAPAHTSDDVDTIVLPRSGYRLDDLRTFEQFHNLRHVRSQQPLTEDQYRVLNASVPATVWFSFNVRMNDGTLALLRSRRSLHWDSFADTNGDGVIDEQEDADLRLVEPVPPRIKAAK